MLEPALVGWLENTLKISAYWLKRPNNNNCVVFRRLSPGMIDANMATPNINQDLYRFSLYHTDADTGLYLANQLTQALHDFSGVIGAPPDVVCMQSASLSGGIDHLPDESGYRFERDFIISY
ncbi:hypothetical protein [Salinivibrio socompensis]|uniref:hypothetical protein n=1 Tax=Salinivibrio socompensis TaxID=1510206 RepID=UPI00046FEE66|nr:hypothetical protein [Salinivibrio socompensis]